MHRDAEKLNEYRRKGKELRTHSQVLEYISALYPAGFRADEQALLLLLVWKDAENSRSPWPHGTVQVLDRAIEIQWSSMYTK